MSKVLAINYLNRVMDVRMEGSYGYMEKRLREAGHVMLTAESVVREFQIDRIDEVDLPHFGKKMCFIGTDYYFREMALPIDRILAMSPKDTEEQGKLRGLNWLLRNVDDMAIREGMTPEQTKALESSFAEFRVKRNALVAAGVREYIPQRASEDEL